MFAAATTRCYTLCSGGTQDGYRPDSVQKYHFFPRTPFLGAERAVTHPDLQRVANLHRDIETQKPLFDGDQGRATHRNLSFKINNILDIAGTHVGTMPIF
jgi:hypothetical protein